MFGASRRFLQRQLAWACLTSTLISSWCIAQTPVSVSLIGGEKVDAQLVGISDNQVTIEAGERQAVPLQQIDHLIFSATTTVETPPLAVTLLDGSELRCGSVTTQGKELICELSGGPQPVALTAVLSVRFTELAPPAAQQWEQMQQQISQETAVRDQLAIQRGENLEFLDGIVLGVSAETVGFELDGQELQAPRAKLAGFLLRQRPAPLPEATGSVQLADGSRLAIVSASMAAGKIEFVLPSNVRIGVQTSLVSRIDFGAGNTIPLSDAPRLATTGGSIFGIAGEAAALLQPHFISLPAIPPAVDIFNPPPPGSSEPGPVSCLMFPGVGSYEVRVPENMTRFQSQLVRPDLSGDLTPVRFRVSSDGDVLWEEVLTLEPKIIDLPVTAGKRLSFDLASDAKLPIGTAARLIEPRFTR